MPKGHDCRGLLQKVDAGGLVPGIGVKGRRRGRVLAARRLRRRSRWRPALRGCPAPGWRRRCRHGHLQHRPSHLRERPPL
eukprot:888708-Lingulodinium_polyedra.AAC.1